MDYNHEVHVCIIPCWYKYTRRKTRAPCIVQSWWSLSYVTRLFDRLWRWANNVTTRATTATAITTVVKLTLNYANYQGILTIIPRGLNRCILPCICVRIYICAGIPFGLSTLLIRHYRIYSSRCTIPLLPATSSARGVRDGAPNQQWGMLSLCVMHRALFIWMSWAVRLYIGEHSLCVAAHVCMRSTAQ